MFRDTPVSGVVIVVPERREDPRGFFARTWCQREFAAHGLTSHLVQCSLSFSPRRGTLRGLHYQAPPATEAKLIRCTRGAIWDVALDVRPGSRTFGRHVAIELTADNRTMLFIGEGLAHGFQTLQDDTEVCYQMSEFYAPAAQRGIRYDDPAFAIPWPIENPVLLDRDRTCANFTVSVA